MLYLATVFSISIFGMAFMLLRHMPKTQHGPKTSLAVPEANGRATLALITMGADRIEVWFTTHIFPFFVSIVSKLMVLIERGAQQVNTRALKARRALFRKSQAQPRESLYWRTISHWRKEEKGVAEDPNATALPETDQDVSHHPLK
ncbi:MAG: hypothetical protein AAB343_02475 [Patescibacteria group bacterium]